MLFVFNISLVLNLEFEFGKLKHLASIRVIVDVPCAKETRVYPITITGQMGSTTVVVKRREQRVLLVCFK